MFEPLFEAAVNPTFADDDTPVIPEPVDVEACDEVYGPWIYDGSVQMDGQRTFGD